VYSLVEEWRRRDRHLWLWESNLRDSALRRRREQYRKLAAELSRRYRTLIIERFDLRGVQVRAVPESEEIDLDAAHAQQQLVAASELRSCLVQAFAARRGRIVELPAAYTTMDCSACGHRHEADYAAEVMVTCPRCSMTEDQDARAGRNLMRIWQDYERADGKQRPEGARVTDYREMIPKRPARWAKRHVSKAVKTEPLADASETPVDAV
jgi:hypothetical protein